MKSNLALRLAVAVSGAALGLAACGGGEDTAVSDPGGPTAEQVRDVVNDAMNEDYVAEVTDLVCQRSGGDRYLCDFRFTLTAGGNGAPTTMCFSPEGEGWDNYDVDICDRPG